MYGILQQKRPHHCNIAVLKFSLQGTIPSHRLDRVRAEHEDSSLCISVHKITVDASAHWPGPVLEYASVPVG